VEGGDQVEEVLLEGEEEDVRVQSELETARDDDVAVEAGHSFVSVLAELDADQTVAIGDVVADIVLHIYHEIVLKGYLEVIDQNFVHSLSKFFHSFLLSLVLSILLIFPFLLF
jgi:type III secretion system FlhB-like substrate exporter